LEPVSSCGKRLSVGDYVRLVRIPPLKQMPPETKIVFRRFLGRLLQVADFEQNGLAELYVARLETIYVEPEFLRLVRRSGASATRSSKGSRRDI